MESIIELSLLEYGIIGITILILFKLYINKLEKIQDTLEELNKNIIDLRSEIKTLIYVLKNNKK